MTPPASQDGEQAVLSGVKPVIELLEREPERIDAVLIRKGRRSQDTDRILDLCRAAKVRFTLTDAQSLDRLCPTGHQGVVARLFEAGFTEFSDLLTAAADAPLPLILVLDQVQDPGNAGTLARTLYALGGAGLVIPRHNGAFLGAGARRAAAGALERLPVAKVMNLSRALDEARDAGFLIYGAAFGEGSLDAFTAPLHTPALLVLGNEEHGIRPQVAKRCHHLLHIPMLREFDSLNVAQAGGILTGCFARRHLEKHPGATS
uniref:TrmH family RNA methyltransferase n=1 Tax=uncultured Bilophila sp. TaxID=529385 RepID=UPI0025D8D6AB|nr:TrmH family RNA methyltransferase [uncultured Bilophila sp.]